GSAGASNSVGAPGSAGASNSVGAPGSAGASNVCAAAMLKAAKAVAASVSPPIEIRLKMLIQGSGGLRPG
ncbi:MAG: hypothetical protein E5X62_30345, partial [Mesorhizobium sp.]